MPFSREKGSFKKKRKRNSQNLSRRIPVQRCFESLGEESKSAVSFERGKLGVSGGGVRMLLL